MSAFRVGIVGAGIAGLAAGRRLKQAGVESVIFEKSAGLGGRCATRRAEGFVFDSGASTIAPRGRRLEQVMTQELDVSTLVEVVKPLWSLAYGKVSPSRNGGALRRWTYRDGNTRLAKLLAEGLDVRLQAKVESIEAVGEQWRIGEELLDHVIVTAPAPQALALVEPHRTPRSLSSARYRACLAVLVGVAQELHVPYHALLDMEQRSPVTWVSLESVKSPDRAPEGHSAVVVQFGAEFSRLHYEDSDGEIAREAISVLKRLYGEGFAQPLVQQVKRWRYSLPETCGTLKEANPPGTRLWVAGDGLTGPRVEMAFESGFDVAEMLLEASLSS